MRHKVGGRKLGRTSAHRKAMFRNMATALFTHEVITTTIPKAKAVKPFVERLITAAKKGDLASRRRVIAELTDQIMVKHDGDDDVERNRYGEVVGGPKVVKKLFDEIGPRFTDRPGGYTRIVRLGKNRIGDGADLCVLMLVGGEEGPQVSGQHSRRREKANRRNEKAAAMRKAASKGDNQPEESTSEEAATAVADEEPATPETEAPEATTEEQGGEEKQDS